MTARPLIPWTRSRRLLWWGSLVAVSVGVVGLGVGCWRFLHVAWRFGSVVPPRSSAPVAEDPEADLWVFRARSVSVMTFRGQLQLARSEYRSIDATREGLDRWVSGPSPWGGWEVINIPASIITRQSDPGTFFRGAGDWRVDAGVAGAVGVFLTGSKGEVVRVVEAPFWVLTLAAAVPGVVVWRRAARLAVRLRRGDCPRCGYAMGASGAVCPECGRRADEVQA